MKIKTNIFILILVLTASFPGYCQISSDCFDMDEINTDQALTGELFTPASPPDIITYFNKSWLNADIWLTDGTIVRNAKIRYNGLLDELLWQEPQSNQTIKLDKEAILQFHFYDFEGDTTIYFRKIYLWKNIINDSIGIFCQELYHGELSLFVSHSFYLDREQKIQVGESYFLKDIYKEEPGYYIKDLKNKIYEFKRFNRTRLYEFMPDKKDQIKEYLKKNMPGTVKTFHEMIQLVQFLSTITEQ